MKRVVLMFVAVVLCSLSAWCQSSELVKLGTEIMENNSFDFAEESFRNKGIYLDLMPSGKYGYISERSTLMIVLDVTSSNKIKEVSFLCGVSMWMGIEKNLEEYGYILTKNGKVTIGNGSTVHQRSYSKGNVLCFVQYLDNNMEQIIFKRKATKAMRKR